MPRLLHFSTRADYDRLAASDEVFSRLCFVEATVYPENELSFVKGLLALPDLGAILDDRYHAAPRYWVFPEKPKVRLRQLPTIDGQERYTLDGPTFDVCLQFQANGLFGKKTVICGSLEVTNPIGTTVRLFREIARAFSRAYTKSKYFHTVTYVGPDALSLQRQRYRLCANPNLPRADDFKLEQKR